VISKILEEFQNNQFRYIVIESPENEIEDINCIFEDNIEFQQIKKIDGDRWTLSSLRDVIKSFYEIFKKQKTRIRDLNLNIKRNYLIKFSFVTNGDRNRGIFNFQIALKKFKNDEYLNSENRENLKLFSKVVKSKQKYQDFIKKINFIFLYHPSSDINNLTKQIKQYCVIRLSELFRLKKSDANLTLTRILDLVFEKSQGFTIKARTLTRKDIIDIISSHKISGTDLKEIFSKNFYEFIDIINKNIELIVGNVDIKQKCLKQIDYPVDLVFKVKGNTYCVIFIENKISEDDLILLKNLQRVIIEEGKIPLFLYNEYPKDFRELKEEYCISVKNTDKFENIFK